LGLAAVYIPMPSIGAGLKAGGQLQNLQDASGHQRTKPPELHNLPAMFLGSCWF